MLNNRVTFLSRFLLPPESARAVPGSVQVWAQRGCKLELALDLKSNAKVRHLAMALPHYDPLWDKMPQNAPLFILECDSVGIYYPLHDGRRQSFARSHAHSAKFVFVTLNVPIKRLSVNSSPVGQFLSCHCFHVSFIFRILS